MVEEEDFLKTEAQVFKYIYEEECTTILTKSFLNMKSHKRAARILRNLGASISCLRRGGDDDKESRGKYVLSGIKNYLYLTPTNRKKLEHMILFEHYRMPHKLFCLYTSPVKNNKEIAEESIRLFLYPKIQSYPIACQHRFGSSILCFCELLRDYGITTTSERLLYYSCRQTYGYLLKSIGPTNSLRFYCDASPEPLIRDFYPFISELTKQLLVNMKLIRESCFCRVPYELKSRFESDIGEFSILILHMYTKTEDLVRMKDLSLDSLRTVDVDWGDSYYEWELKSLYDDFNKLLDNIDLGLTYMDDGVEYTRCTECKFNHGWSYYLSILKELDVISKLYHPAKKSLSSCLYSHRDSINKLIMRSQRGDDHHWLLRHKSLLNNESRRHLICMMFPEQLNNGFDDRPSKKTKVTIDRSKLLVDSFEQVGLANTISLRNGIIPLFKNEVAIDSGPDVFSEWILLVCQHLFNPLNSLFVSCPHDSRRFYLGPVKVDSQQLEYYRFCGRMVALALMHNVQIGIGFAHLFFLQLTGSIITIEDIRDADPYMYKSCKDILEMDTKLIDSDSLGLTFVWKTEEVDESGSGRKGVELCHGGSEMGVYSINREEYVQLVIQHCFVKSVAEKVKLFIRGLDDVLTRRCRKNLFQSMELEDFDHVLLDRTLCEKNRDESRNHSEAVEDCRAPFQKIIGTTLPISRLKSSSMSLTCRAQHRPFCFTFS